MILLHPLAALLDWLGRQGTRAVAVSVFLGLAVPPLAALLKPFITEAIVALMVLAFLRVEPAELRGHLTRPGPILMATLWTMVAAPALFAAVFVAFGLHEQAPGLMTALVLQAVAPPLMSAPAFAALLGLGAAAALLTLIACMALAPLTSPLFVDALLGGTLTMAPLALGLRLFLIVAGSALAAALLRRLAGPDFIATQKVRIDGLNVVLLFVFAVALMDGLTDRLLAEPLLVLGLTALSFALSLGMVALTALVFVRRGRAGALAVGLLAGFRNMGLMLAATGGAVPELTWLYFAVAQFPIYLSPQLLKPLARRFHAHLPGGIPPA